MENYSILVNFDPPLIMLFKEYSNNALSRHEKEVHSNVNQNYTTRILTRERTNLPLNIIEGLYIEKQKLGTTMNGKNENGRGAMVRLVATRVNL